MNLDNKFLKHKTKRNALIKFILVMAILVVYFAVVSWQYGVKNGIQVTALTWSFFVFCTPIGDAGFLLDFPIRLITKIRMIYSEIIVWAVALVLNIYFLTSQPQIYNKTELLNLFHYILVNPIPFWSIIIVSAAGTFMSIYFGDELIDVAKHEHRKKYRKHRIKHRIIIAGAVGLGVVILYFYILNQLPIDIPVF